MTCRLLAARNNAATLALSGVPGSMREIRKYLSWIFAFTAVVCFSISFSLTPKMLRHHPPIPNLSPGWRIFLVAAPWLFPMSAAVFSIAWWTSFKEKPSARVWGIVASLVNVLNGLFPVLIPPHSIFSGFLLILAAGVAGLIAFAWPIDKSEISLEQLQSAPIPGDGTSNLFNKVAPLYSLIAGGAAFSWWLKWMRSKEVPFDHSNTYLTLASILIVLMVIGAHECGHAAVGLSLGMKLRAFMIGPFQWSIRSGKWQFHFDPRQILMESGATGLVPTVVNFPRWAYVCTLLGGGFANAVTGTIALWLALTGDPLATFQVDGLLALFGAWSLLMGIINLVPFRTQIGYSDGAQIYQWAANGVWADFHRLFGIVGATLVTPLRPRDYDIDVIIRVSQSITQGPYASTLRLLAYWYFLDQGRIREAGEALTQVTKIYNNTASNVPPGLPPVLVFGAAYILRDAEAARAWWKRSQDAKPKCFDTEFWLAASAFHWVNGNLDDANQALSKADLLAQKLPNAGAYEFERHCCSLLRHALNEVSTPA